MNAPRTERFALVAPPCARAGRSREVRSSAREYFAFGSNLDLDQMFARCPDARVLGPARLRGFRLAFTGYSAAWGGAVATVVADEARVVRGLLYELSDDDFSALDRYEGHPRWYERCGVHVRLGGARRDRAVETYVAPLLRGLESAPSREYLEQIVRAYRRLGFAQKPLRDALDRCITEDR